MCQDKCSNCQCEKDPYEVSNITIINDEEDAKEEQVHSA